MRQDEQITSSQNPTVKLALSLRDRRDRDKTGLFLIEGYRELLRAIDGNAKIQTLLVCSELYLGNNEPHLIERCRARGAKVLHCAPHILQKLSYRDRSEGLLAIAYQRHQGLDELSKRLSTEHPAFLLVAEAVEKPGNLGTILRSGDAVGLDALVVCDACTDIYNPNVVRASVGTLFTVPVIECTTAEAIPWLRAHDIAILAATPQAKELYTEVDLTKPIAIAVGTEQLGLSDAWMDQADLQVRIPMCGVADSLNVATATTLLLYEVLRQRAQR